MSPQILNTKRPPLAASTTATTTTTTTTTGNTRSMTTTKPSSHSLTTNYHSQPCNHPNIIEASSKSSERSKVFRCRFFVNGDRHFTGIYYVINLDRLRTLDSLCVELSRILINVKTLPSGVRIIFNCDDGSKLDSIKQFRHNENYCCSSTEHFIRLDYQSNINTSFSTSILNSHHHHQDRPSFSQEQGKLFSMSINNNNNNNPSNLRHGSTKSRTPLAKRRVGRGNVMTSSTASNSSTQTLSTTATTGISPNSLPYYTLRPKLVALLRGSCRSEPSMRPSRRVFRFLLNHRIAQNYEQLLNEISKSVKLNIGAVHRIYALSSSKKITCLNDLYDDECVYLVYGRAEKCNLNDFLLDEYEQREICSIVGASYLNSFYENNHHHHHDNIVHKSPMASMKNRKVVRYFDDINNNNDQIRSRFKEKKYDPRTQNRDLSQLRSHHNDKNDDIKAYSLPRNFYINNTNSSDPPESYDNVKYPNSGFPLLIRTQDVNENNNTNHHQTNSSSNHWNYNPLSHDKSAMMSKFNNYENNEKDDSGDENHDKYNKKKLPYNSNLEVIKSSKSDISISQENDVYTSTSLGDVTPVGGSDDLSFEPERSNNKNDSRQKTQKYRLKSSSSSENHFNNVSTTKTRNNRPYSCYLHYHNYHGTIDGQNCYFCYSSSNSSLVFVDPTTDSYHPELNSMSHNYFNINSNESAANNKSNDQASLIVVSGPNPNCCESSTPGGASSISCSDDFSFASTDNSNSYHYQDYNKENDGTSPEGSDDDDDNDDDPSSDSNSDPNYDDSDLSSTSSFSSLSGVTNIQLITDKVKSATKRASKKTCSDTSAKAQLNSFKDQNNHNRKPIKQKQEQEKLNDVSEKNLLKTKSQNLTIKQKRPIQKLSANNNHNHNNATNFSSNHRMSNMEKCGNSRSKFHNTKRKPRPITVTNIENNTIKPPPTLTQIPAATKFQPKKEVGEIYFVDKSIGDGKFGVVYTCIHRATRQSYALKVVDKYTIRQVFPSSSPPHKQKREDSQQSDPVNAEVAILSRVQHPNIVRLYDYFDYIDQCYLVLELLQGGDLFDAITLASRYSEREAAAMISDLLNALNYLHELNIIHRDIKLENLLVSYVPTKEFNSQSVDAQQQQRQQYRRIIKLADFGLAVEVKQNEKLYTVCGTPTYVAPEILLEIGYSFPVDIWAAGVILFILLSGLPPFVNEENDQVRLFDQIISGKFEFYGQQWRLISDSAKRLIESMLCVEQSKRITAQQALNNFWLLHYNSKPLNDFETS